MKLMLSRKKLRRRMKQRRFARLAGVSESHLSLCLSGKRVPGRRILAAWHQYIERSRPKATGFVVR